jgi:hypothetical protein
MPNFQCERCEQRMCRVRCSECDKPVCEPCRLVIKRLYVCRICDARRMPVIRMTHQVVNAGIPSTWSNEVAAELDAMHKAYGRPFGIQPVSARITEYSWRSPQNNIGTLRDSYTRIGKHYRCSRDMFVQNGHDGFRILRIKFPMHLSDEQKLSIIAEAMHPRRLDARFERGFSIDDWCNTFH